MSEGATTITPIRRDPEGRVVMLDQRALPFDERYLTYETAEAVAGAIRDMVIRGAPAIGVAAAYGLALGARALPPDRFRDGWARMCEHMAGARPTAVNLAWAIARLGRLVAAFEGPHGALLDAIDAEAQAIYDEDLGTNRAIGRHGAPLIDPGARVLTHCNTGSLATAGYGTALGVIRAAHAQGKGITVLADETRPYLQGARLTAWECLAEGIDVTVIADSAAGHLMQRGAIDVAIVGADRVAANGDTANKIGTYQVAVLCERHGIPFYVAAPRSTVDLSLATGAEIPIEERDGDEIRTVFGHAIAPADVKVVNPAFDVTPASLITGIITERGVARAPFGPSLARLLAAD